MCAKMADRQGGDIEDRGWQQMKAMLDREMPVERKKRFFWWPLIGAAAMVLLLGGTIFRVQDRWGEKLLPTNSVQSKIENAIRDPAVVSVPNTSDNEILFEDDLQAESTEVSNEKQAATKNLLRSDRSLEKEARDQEVLLVDQPDLVLHSPKETVNEGFSPPSDKLLNQDVNTESRGVDLTANDLNSEVHEVRPLQLRSFAIDFTRRIDGAFRPWDAPKFEEATIIANKKHWGIAPVASVLGDRTGHRWGFDLGLQAEYVFGSFVALESGVSFFVLDANQQYASLNSPNPQWSSDSFSDRQSLDNASNPDQIAGNEMVVAKVGKSRYVRIPFQLRFFPARRIQPYVGADRLILISDDREREAESIIQSPGFGNSISVQNLDLRAANWAWKAGAVWQAGEHLFFDFSYAHGNRSYVNAMVKEGAHFEIHRYFRLGMGYRFGRW